MKRSKRKRLPAIHPWIAGVYPILALLAFNIDQAPISAAFRALLLVLLASKVIWLIFQHLVRDYYKSAILTTAALIFFFIYGHIYSYGNSTNAFWGEILGSHPSLALIAILTFAAIFFLLTKKNADVVQLTKVLNFIGAALLTFSLFQIASYEISLSAKISNFNNEVIPLKVEGYENLNEMPDIYYIILDMYTRTDFLKDQMGFDNVDFIEQLRKKDFI